MKAIDKTKIPGATLLTPLDMNRIHFETGRHTEVAGSNADTLTPAK